MTVTQILNSMEWGRERMKGGDMKTTLYRGKINGFSGSWMSGLGFLIINGKGIPCDNAPTVRALDGCFGNVISEGHTVNSKAIQDKDIVYSMDGMGMILEAFTPTRDWRRMYGKKFTPRLGESLEIETDDLVERNPYV